MASDGSTECLIMSVLCSLDCVCADVQSWKPALSLEAVRNFPEFNVLLKSEKEVIYTKFPK